MGIVVFGNGKMLLTHLIQQPFLFLLHQFACTRIYSQLCLYDHLY